MTLIQLLVCFVDGAGGCVSSGDSWLATAACAFVYMGMFEGIGVL